MSKKSKGAKKKGAQKKGANQQKKSMSWQRIALLAVGAVAVAGAGWMAVQPAVGEGHTIHVLRSPT